MVEQLRKMSPSLAALSAADGADVLSLPYGTRLVLKRWAPGLPVPCLNASGHGSGDFVGLAERLDSDFELIAVDRPGMDRPPPDRSAGLAPGKEGGLAPLDGPARFLIGHMGSFFRAGKRGAVWFFAAVAAHSRSMVLSGMLTRAHRARVVGAGRDLAPVLADACTSFGEPAGDLTALAPWLSLPVWLACARSKRVVAHMPVHGVTLFQGGHSAFRADPEAFVATLQTLVVNEQPRSPP